MILPLCLIVVGMVSVARTSLDFCSLVFIFVMYLVCCRAVACVSTAVCLWSWLDAGWVHISMSLFGVDCGVHGGLNRK